MASLTRLEPGSFRKFDNRLAFLIGQSVSLGITLALLIITASALFLTRFGSQNLPYVYIAVAILGSLVFYGYAELQRRSTLPSLSIATIAAIALFIALSWLGITFTGAGWITFLLMVSFSLIIQMGFVLLGNQAGRLFDVREMKSKFPRVVAGFAIGFLLGGFIASILANVIGRTENLLLLATISSLSMLSFLIITDRRFHDILIQAGSIQRRQPGKPLWQLLAKRFVLLVVLYQMLSAMVSQLLDFMLFDQAAARYTDSLGLAQFLGNFTIAVNLSDILFLALFAGLLLSRFGLKFGMAANPIADLVVLVIEIGVGLALGINNGLFFILVMSARIVDITLTDGTTRGSINTAYQALPAHERVTVQTGVEGIGVPVALGLTGVILLLFNAISGLTILHIAIFTFIVGVGWAGSAFLAYRGYAGSLVQTLRRRALDPAELSLDDGSSRAVVEGFLNSNNIREVRLALDLLENGDQQALDEKLIALLNHPNASIRVEALGRIERHKVALALPAVRDCLESETDSLAIAAAVQAYCALDESGIVEGILSYLSDNNREVQRGAGVGLLRYGGIPGVLAAGQWLTSLEGSIDPADRQLAARIIGDVETANFYQPLLELLDDENLEVRRAALIAAGRVRHPRLLPLIIDNLDQPGSRSAAMTAVLAYGDTILPQVRRALEEKSSGGTGRAIRLLRACGQIRGDNVIDFLKEHIDRPEGDMQTALLGALCSSGYKAEPGEVQRIRAILDRQMAVAVRLLVAGQEVGAMEATAPLRRALADELANVRQRIFYLLTYLFDRPVILKAAERLKFGNSSQQALAMETLDVVLPGNLKNWVLPLVDPRLPVEQKAQQLANILPVPGQGLEGRLVEIIMDGEGAWNRPWIRVCAIYAAGKLGFSQTAEGIEAALSADEPAIRETAAWALSNLAPHRFQAHLAALLTDQDPRVAHLAAEMAAIEH